MISIILASHVSLTCLHSFHSHSFCSFFFHLCSLMHFSAHSTPADNVVFVTGHVSFIVHCYNASYCVVIIITYCDNSGPFSPPDMGIAFNPLHAVIQSTSENHISKDAVVSVIEITKFKHCCIINCNHYCIIEWKKIVPFSSTSHLIEPRLDHLLAVLHGSAPSATHLSMELDRGSVCFYRVSWQQGPLCMRSGLAAPKTAMTLHLCWSMGSPNIPLLGWALSLKPSFSTDRVVALGWGKDKTGKMVKDLQQTTSVEVIQNRFCDDEDYWPSLKESMICAFGIESNQNLCEGMAHHCWALTKAGCNQSSDLFSHPESVRCFHFTIAVWENDFTAHQNGAAKTPHLYRGQNRATILDFATQAIHRPSPHVFHLWKSWLLVDRCCRSSWIH